MEKRIKTELDFDKNNQNKKGYNVTMIPTNPIDCIKVNYVITKDGIEFISNDKSESGD